MAHTAHNARSDSAQPFSDSQEAHWRRFVRNAIRRAPLTRSERDVTLALVNLWLHHRNGPEGAIHPGRVTLAKKAKCSVATVKRTLAHLRDCEALIPISNMRGGQRATRYRISILKMLTDVCGAPLPEWMDGDLTERDTGKSNGSFNGSNKDQKTAKVMGQNDPRYIYTVQPFPSQRISNDNSIANTPTQSLDREWGK